MTPRAVLDTNVIVSMLLSSSGAPAQLVELFRLGRFQICLSDQLFVEYCEVLARPKILALTTRSGSSDRLVTMLADIERVAIRPTTPLQLVRAVPDDSEDDMVLATAIACTADVIVSGDKHILRLKPSYREIRILTPRELADELLSSPGR